MSGVGTYEGAVLAVPTAVQRRSCSPSYCEDLYSRYTGWPGSSSLCIQGCPYWYDPAPHLGRHKLIISEAPGHNGHIRRHCGARRLMNVQLQQPITYKMESTGREVYCYVRDFGPMRDVRCIIPKIVDFGASIMFDDADDHSIHLIESDHYRRPRMILGCGCGMSVDMRNMGVLMRSPG